MPRFFLALAAILPLAGHDSLRVCVDPDHGDDAADGGREHPLRSIGAALDRLPDPVREPVEIVLRPGVYSSAGTNSQSLCLDRRMSGGVRVVLAAEGAVELTWICDGPLVDVREGSWVLRGVRIGNGSDGQKRGLSASGSAEVVLDDVTFRLRSRSDAGIVARRGGRVALRGKIELNVPPPDAPDSFSGIVATDHGVVEFDERSGSSLELGNGNLMASYWGSIRLGCERASITSRTDSNCLSIGNSGRIDLRNTPLRLIATNPRNTPIGLEDDGHVLAEDARITIEGTNESAIALQKASTLWCNDVELKGTFGIALWASSQSAFVGAFVGDVGRLEASTGAAIHVERAHGKLAGPFDARSGATISLPGRVITSR